MSSDSRQIRCEHWMVFQTLADLAEIEWELTWHVATHELVKQTTIKACTDKVLEPEKKCISLILNYLIL